MFSGKLRAISSLGVWLAFGASLTLTLRAAAPGAAYAQESKAAPETICTRIRASISELARAEREEALALHLMSGGQPTPMVESRLIELQTRIGDLREVLRSARHAAPPGDQSVSECINLGFKSLSAAESLSSQIEDIVRGEAAPLGPPPRLKSDELQGAEKLQPRVPDGPSREE